MRDANAPEAYRMGQEGVSGLVSVASSLSRERRDQSYAANKPKVKAKKKKCKRLARRCRRLTQTLDRLDSRRPSDPPSISSLVFTVFFILVAAALAYKTIEPFNLGIIGVVFAAGLSFLAPFATDRFLRRFSQYVWVAYVLDIVLFLASITTLVFFAHIRADEMQHWMNGTAAVVFESDPSAPAKVGNSADAVGDLLRWAMILAALGFELASGLAWFSYMEGRRSTNHGLRKAIEKDLLAAEQQYLTELVELQQSLSGPGLAYAKFWADFRQGLSDGIDKIGRNGRIGGIVLLMMIASQIVQAADKLHLIAEVDFSQTELAKSYSGRSEFEENLSAVSRLLANLPPATRIGVLAISDRGLTDPYPLLNARTSEDTGYFNSRLTIARQRLVSEWGNRTKELSAKFPHSDILGTCIYAGQILSASTAERKALLIYGDMRQDVGLDLETPATIDIRKSLEYIEQRKLFASLNNTEVWVFGAGPHGGAKKNMEYWQGLRGFWLEWFRRSGAAVRVFSPGRESEAILDLLRNQDPKR
jgi:hypothetical protein